MITIDGWITIGTRLKTEQFDKQIKELENKIDSEEKKQAQLNNKTKEYQGELRKATREVSQLKNQLNSASAEADRLKGELEKSGQMKNPAIEENYERQNALIDELISKLDKAEAKQTKFKDKVAQTKLQQENSTKAVDKMRGKLELVNMKRHLFQMKEFEKSVNKVKDGVQNTIGKIGKMAMAVLGVRSAFMLLRQASSTWAQYNQQYAKDLEYIRFALASGLAPILEKIVNLAQTLMAYVNYLTNALFGRPFFGSAKDFESMQKSASGVAKSTKEIKNNLAGFDELNVLGSNQNAGGAGGGITTPSLNLEEVEIPEWLVKLKDILKPVVDFFSEINDKYGPVATGIGVVVSALAGFYTIKGLISLFTGLGKAFGGFSADFTGFLNSIGKAVKAIAILGGLALVINAVSNLIKTFSESGLTLNEVLGLMATILVSIVATMGSVALLGPAMTAGLVPFLGVVAGISAILAVMALTLPTILEAVGKFVNDIAPGLSTIILSIGNGISAIITSLGTILPPIIESIGALFTNIFDGIVKIIQAVIDAIIKLEDSTLDFISGLGPAINNFVNGVIQAVTKLVNFLISAIEYMVNLVISGVNKIIDAINSVGENVGFTIPRLSAFEIPRFVPKLARGGIVAKPTQAIIGEAGREAVMPLDNNTEWMDLLADRLSERLGTGTGEQEFIFRFEGTMAQFVRELKPYIEVENKRVGTRIITGGAY